MTAFAATPAPALDLAVIDYGMGNLRSVLRAFERVGGRPRLATLPAEIARADALVFPGQGAIVDCMKALKANGLDEAVRAWIAADKPFFGVCLGLQALFEHSEEGDTPGLGIFPGRVVRFRLAAPYKIPHMGWNDVKWKVDCGARSAESATVASSPVAGNSAPVAQEPEQKTAQAQSPQSAEQPLRPSRPGGSPKPETLLESLAPEGTQFYFVHSYHAETPDRSLVWGETDYGYTFTSAIRRGNCVATQFHPEKSQAAGLRLYRNFLELASCARNRAKAI